MTTIVVKDRPVWFAQFAVGDVAKAVSLDYGADALDDTVLTDSTHSRKGGLKTVGFSVEAFFDAAALESGVTSRVGTSEVPLSCAPDGEAEGDLAYLLPAMAAETQPVGGSVGELGMHNLSGSGDVLVRGVVGLNDTLAGTGTGVGATEDFGSAQSGTLYAALHVLSFTGTSLDVTIEEDDNASFTSATEVLAFAQNTAAGSEWKSGTPSERYFRVTYDFTGTSVVAVVTFGIVA